MKSYKHFQDCRAE